MNKYILIRASVLKDRGGWLSEYHKLFRDTKGPGSRAGKLGCHQGKTKQCPMLLSMAQLSVCED